MSRSPFDHINTDTVLWINFTAAGQKGGQTNKHVPVTQQ